MSDAATIIVSTAATIGVVHTLIGVDHTLPFVVLARSQGWSLRKLLAVTAVCGLAHVASSVVIGVGGIGLGVALGRLEWIEQARGGVAARLLIGFGLAYMAWGLWRGRRSRRHTHAHAHEDGVVHVHEHDHAHGHAHVHGADDLGGATKTLSVLGLFVVFVLGPCEALIPMLVAPAFEESWLTVTLVVAVFAAATLATMLTVVTLGWLGLRWRGFASVEAHMHTIAGFAIAASGFAIESLGL